MKVLVVLGLFLFSLTTGAQTIITYAGGGTNLSDGVPATSAQIMNPQFGTFDKKGNYFFSEIGNGTIQRINGSGIITTIAGSGILGFGGDNGPATIAKLHYPEGVVCDSSGNLFIADNQNFRIRKVDLTTGIISTYAGSGSPGLTGDGGPATAARFQPVDICFDQHQNLYISDNGHHVIRKVSTNGVITTFAGTGIAGFYGDNNSATNAKLNRPNGITIDDFGNLYIADAGNNRIRKIDTSGIITTVAGTGVPLFIADGLPATETQMKAGCIAFDKRNNSIYSSDSSQRVLRIDLWGVVHHIAGTGVGGYNGDNISASVAQLNSPGGIAIDICGDIYIADNLNNRIRKIELNPNCWPADVEKNTAANGINVYPNPVNDELHIDNIKTQAEYRILSVVGVVMQQGPLKAGSNNILIQLLPAGMYMVEVAPVPGGGYGGRSERVVKRIIKE